MRIIEVYAGVKMKRKTLLWTISIFISILALAFYLTHLPSNDNIHEKKKLISLKLKEKGFNGGFVIISEKRHRWYNKILSNSIDKSSHLRGMAMDFWIMDLNDDGKWNRKDIDLMVITINEIEKEHPELAGWTGTYHDKGALSSRMVHTDVSGIKNRWKQ